MNGGGKREKNRLKCVEEEKQRWAAEEDKVERGV